MMEYKELLFEKKEKIGKVTLNRPDKLNTLTPSLIDEMNQVFAKDLINSFSCFCYRKRRRKNIG